MIKPAALAIHYDKGLRLLRWQWRGVSMHGQFQQAFSYLLHVSAQLRVRLDGEIEEEVSRWPTRLTLAGEAQLRPRLHTGRHRHGERPPTMLEVDTTSADRDEERDCERAEKMRPAKRRRALT